MAEAFNYGVHYRTWHDESDAHRDDMCAGTLLHLGSYLPPERDRPVLDIGCGMGFAMMAMQRAGFRSIRGVDIDASQIEASKRRQLDVEHIADLEAYLAGHPGYFGLVLMLDVLEHIPVAAQINVLRAIHAAMAPGGRLIVQVPNATSILAARWQFIDFTHVSSFTEHSILFALRSAQFNDVSVPPLENHMPRPSLRPHKLFAKKNRWHLRRWLVRWAWKQVLKAELPGEDVSRIPLALNLLAIADKAA